MKIKKFDLKSKKIELDKTVMGKLIPQKEYFIFLDDLVDHDIITPCQNKSAKNNYIKISKIDFYEDFNNSIVESYINYMKKEKKMYLFTRLYLLLIHFVSEEKAFKILRILKSNKDITDVEFIQMFSKLTFKERIPAIYEKYNMKKENNFEYCDKRMYVFEKIKRDYVKLFKKINDQKYSERDKMYPNYRYLDIGCGNGKKTELFANLCKIPMNKVFCADVAEWGPYSKNKKFKFQYQQIYQDNLLQFPDKHFQLITCFLTLHHVEQLTVLIKEINRVLDDNGIFLIIEHDVFNIEDNLIINIQHMIYSYTRDGKKDLTYYKNYIKNSGTNFYLNYLEWDFLMKKHGFEYTSGNMILEDLSHIPSYDNQNYGFYRKKKN